VSVHLARADELLAVEVIDNGVGLPEDFDADGSRGLGLSIVQALVTGELEGSIELRSNGGTVVRVEVPVSLPRVEP
jgi:two-component sensor histidine kinase